ncbi:uncharacterized protein ACA1_338040 [Acanthamoeba castellanii str. Neff]|uniref:Peptidase S74 domain-containing protein n=1 Tax=Acanthamoeba castellanii (strain ATCC 30010 / Neff) TaxID=1257118 RepID=L8GD03_ACACF|nr:uncharacterized protein ACA1_338040 [Acanthamoeba castellanii str. Neff]ELR10947.1 hypothetical protein ACA1_338040 [Acanthamoeba castellanii str. Neff]
MEAPHHGGGAWPALSIPAPLVGIIGGDASASTPGLSWRSASTDGMEVGGLVSASAGQDELAQLFLNLESLPSTDEALGHLMAQQQQTYPLHQHYHQQQQQQQQQHPQSYNQSQHNQYPTHQPSAGPVVFDLPQIEPFGVKQEAPSPPASSSSSSSTVGLSAALFHKPRGSQGQWVGLLAHDRIRVTKGKGKKLRLEVKCSKPFDLSELSVWLIDEDGSSLQGFTLDTTKSKIEMETTGTCVATVEVNLIKISKRLQFGARVASATQGWSCQAATLPFTAHNNGKDRVQHGGPTVHSSPGASPGFVHSQPASSPDPHPIPTGKKRKVSTQGEPLRSPLDAAEKVTQLEGTLRVEGDVRARAFIQYSDLRLKTDVASLVDALNVIEKLEPKSYKWLPNAPGLPARVEDTAVVWLALNFLAYGVRQTTKEVQKVLPDVVYQDPVTGYLSVAYTELVPVIIEALKEHLKEYATDKAHFQHELDSLRAALSQLQSASAPGPYDGGDPDNGADGDNAGDSGDDDDEDGDDDDGDLGVAAQSSQNPRDIVQTVRERKRELRELTRQLNQIKRDAKRQHRQEKQDRKASKREDPRREERQNSRNAKREERQAALEKKKFQEHLMMDPIKLNKDVLRYQTTAFKLASKRGAQLAVALIWDRGSIPDLTLHVHKPGMALREHTREKKKKSCTIVTVQSLPRLTTSDSESSDSEEEAEEAAILGQYNISVTLHGGFAYHLKQSRAVVAVYDFRDASTQPLTVSATSVVGDMGQTWLVGSFLVARNVFRWTQTPNVIASSLPEEWRYADDKGQAASRGYGLLPRRVYLRAAKGHYLSASRDGTMASTLPSQGPGFDEAWDVEFDVEGFASLRSSHGTYLSVDPKTGRFGTVEAGKGAAGPAEKLRYLLDDASSTLALVALLPAGPAYLQVSPGTGELTAADALRPYVADGDEAALPGQKDGGAAGDAPSMPSGTPPSPKLVRYKAAGRAQGDDHCADLSDSMEEESDDDDEDDDDDDDDEAFMRPGAGGQQRQRQKQMAPPAAQQMRLPAEAERWVMEAAPTRDQQQARQAQEVWTQLQANFSILSLSSSLRTGGTTAPPHM